MSATNPVVNPAVPANNGYTTGRRMSAGRLRLSYLGSVRAELTKLLSIKSTYWLLGITILLIVAGGAVAAASYKTMAYVDYNAQTGEMVTLQTPRAMDAESMWLSTTVMVSTAAVVIGIFGVMAITSEYTNLTIQSGFVANPRRGMYLAAKGTVVAILAFLTALIGVGLSWAAVRLVLGDIPVSPLPDAQRTLPWVCILGAPALSMVMSIMALGLGAICRSSVGGVFALIGVWNILPSLLGAASLSEKLRPAVMSITNCLPSTAMGDFFSGATNLGSSQSTGSASAADLVIGVAAARKVEYFDPTWWQSGLIFLAWAAVVYAIGLMVLRRADVK